MIPKIIWNIWIGDESPALIKHCLATQNLEGYEVRHINNDNYHHCRYVDECIEAKKYGKAADYLRMYYLYHHGGIYLDADTEAPKPFDDVLDNEMVVCEEKNGFVANGIVGVIPKHPMLARYLKLVDENFIGSGAVSYTHLTLPTIA